MHGLRGDDGLRRGAGGVGVRGHRGGGAASGGSGRGRGVEVQAMLLWDEDGGRVQQEEAGDERCGDGSGDVIRMIMNIGIANTASVKN